MDHLQVSQIGTFSTPKCRGLISDVDMFMRSQRVESLEVGICLRLPFAVLSEQYCSPLKWEYSVELRSSVRTKRGPLPRSKWTINHRVGWKGASTPIAVLACFNPQWP